MPARVQNFGRNVAFTPSHSYTPGTEQEVLEIMQRHEGQRIRVAGRLHAWSEAARSDEVLLDLRRLATVQVHISDNEVTATIGAGCQIKRAVSELWRQAGVTTPTIGLIDEQAIAGAISTGTHGSGRHSISHYVQQVRLATFDPQTGRPAIREISQGDPLRAARCSLGLLGVILSVTITCRPCYRVEEFVERYETIDEVLAHEAEYPLQQFFYIPWSWNFQAQHRRETQLPRSRLASLYRWYWLLGIDYGLHLVLIFLANVARSPRLTWFFYRRLLPWLVIRRWRVVDRAEAILTMHHEAFRHIEIELFVRESRLKDALPFVRDVISAAAGQTDASSEDTIRRLDGAGMLDEFHSLHDTYVHHYPICVRRILPDDTLISMAAGDEPVYSLSFISYHRRHDRAGFFQFADFLARSMGQLFQARPHWGKVCPIDGADAARLYPELEKFRELAQQYDGQHVFRNAWTERTLWPPRTDASEFGGPHPHPTLRVDLSRPRER